MTVIEFAYLYLIIIIEAAGANYQAHTYCT